MAEQQTVAPLEEIKVGQIVEFTEYTALEEGMKPNLKKGDKVIISSIGDDGQGHPTFEVRPVGEDGKPDGNRDGDMLFSDEFSILEPAAKKPAKKRATSSKRQTERAAKPKAASKKKAEAKPATKPAKKSTAKTKKAAAAKAKDVTKEPSRPGSWADEVATSDVDSATGEADVATQEVKPMVVSSTGSELRSENVSVMTSPEGYEHDPVVIELIRSTNNIVEVARDLSARHEEIYFKLGGVLAKIQDDKLHTMDGRYEDNHEGFQRYVDENISNLGRRKAYHLIKIYKQFRLAGISASDLQGMGWTKARILTQIEPDLLARDKDDLLERGRNSTRTDLEEYVRRTYVNAKDGGETIEKYRWNFIMFGEENMMVERAIALAKEQLDDDVDEKRQGSLALQAICTEYVTMTENVEGAASMVPEDEVGLLAAAERLGITIEFPEEQKEQEQEDG